MYPRSIASASLAAGAALWITVSSSRAEAHPSDDPVGSNYIADIAEKVTPAVVNITTERTRRPASAPFPPGHPLFPELFGPGQRRPEKGAGSGVVISADGYIVTNNHVVENADQIKVSFNDKSEYRAKLIGTDKPSDLALIKIEAKGMPHLSFGDASRLRLGEYVLAVGNPFGVGQTVTMGIVSAKGRANIGIVDYEDFIQTDAAINPGNSGGALVSMKGELVGINTAILSRSGGAQGIGFAVPANMAQPILQQIKQHGRVRRGWLGVGIQDLTPDLVETLKLQKETEGVLITTVMEDGPAAKAELQPEDVVMSVNGKKARQASDLRNLVAMLGPGAKAQLEVLRGGKKISVTVALSEKKDESEQAVSGETSSSVLSGLSLRDLNEEARAQLHLPKKLEGVVVTEVEPGSAAEDAGLREGDVITQIDRARVRSTDDLRKLELDKRDRVLLRVYREGSNLFLVLRR
ncbi:MAG: DegQ family serine endoprotease [Deltaproteobacteria bacterium]|nr:DegQ family serine endoprotease [Deltaproteobacteria bacterium]